VFEPGDSEKGFKRETYFPWCGRHSMYPLSDYETPAEYKASACTDLSDMAQVWRRVKAVDGGWCGWRSMIYEDAKKSYLWETEYQILIGGPEPPPDDWKGE
jgi:hypothetical protein